MEVEVCAYYYPEKNRWEIIDIKSNKIASSHGPYEVRHTTHDHVACFKSNKTYVCKFYDANGGFYGHYKLSTDRNEIKDVDFKCFC